MRRRERGIVLLAMVAVLLAVFLGVALVTVLRDNPRLAAESQATHRLADARDALVGHAKAEWCRLQTGTVVDHLPCPDRGAGIEGAADAGCAASAVGRLPWRTLGLPPLRDGAGECLWYALDRTAGSARVIAPGATRDGQTRTPDGSAPVCGGNYDPTQYLESGGNDIVLPIAAADLAEPAGCSAAAPPAPKPECVAAAGILLGKVSGNENLCHGQGNQTAPECIAAVSELASHACSCAAAGNTFINPPCRNNFNSPQCQNAIAELQTCG
jgi:hypothetical protein